MPTFETTKKVTSLNTLMQDTLDAGGELILTLGNNNYADLAIVPPKKEEKDV